mmetsp:Transcript_4407/g.6983  ORF Transcript_4407/g.6983 Transcript_4407/m.6983 type:complete len:129 (-) Transcript_4407:854-1240(-)|eukprot:CAMPEP_0175099270 /NCGR_PEP_ID=MMETSP0086_2-20121207/6350_1 /TAXON_ID=136419 /ORGANISM="Unknown Unknown, Strain D1" /LENGTH=128 /DNA_ID=CAMNT_0016373075 /DNA_START=200 /DNA_END=586 /DNA_ORIENTATION=-
MALKWIFVGLVLLVAVMFLNQVMNSSSCFKYSSEHLNNRSLMQSVFHDNVIQNSLDAHETKNAFSGMSKISSALGSLKSLCALSGGSAVLKEATGQDITKVNEILRVQYSNFVSAIEQNGHQVPEDQV